MVARRSFPSAANANLTSDFWKEPRTSSAQLGVGIAEWMAEVEKTGVRDGKALKPEAVGSSTRPIMITQPTGTQRPPNEVCVQQVPPNSLSAYNKRFDARVPIGEQTSAALKLLEQRLRSVEPGKSRLLQSDMFRACQFVKIPLDDGEIRLAVRKCSVDSDGRREIDDFLAALQSLVVNDAAVRSKIPTVNWPGSKEVPGGLEYPKRPPPKHAYNAASLRPGMAPAEGDKGLAKLQRVDRDDETQPWHGRPSYSLLSAQLDAQPQSRTSAARQQQLTAIPGRGLSEQLLALKMALVKQDHTKRGVLPSKLVKEYTKLYRLWDVTLPPAPELLRQAEEGRSMVKYGHFLNGLDQACAARL